MTPPDATTGRDVLASRLGSGVEMGAALPQGVWSRAYAFRRAGRDLVVRFNPERHAFDIDLLALRFASPSLPIPKVLEVGEFDGGFYAISERAFGDFLEELDPPAFLAAVPSLLETLDAMCTADTSNSVGYGPWAADGSGRYASWAEYLLQDLGIPHSSRSNWRETLAQSALAERAFNEGREAQAELAPRCPNLRNLIHSDLLNRNVFVSEGRLTALIDWQCAMYGDHLYDLAWLTFWAPWHPGLAASDVGNREREHWRDRGVVIEDFDLRVRCYEIHIGLGHLVYNAWRSDARNLEETARRTLEVLG